MSRYSTPGQNRPLSTLQKRAILALARSAYEIAREHDLTDLPFDEWRHTESVKACGTTISKASNGDYNKLKAHFQNEKGDTKGALESLDKDATDAYRTARHALDRELALRSLPPEYVEKICRDEFNCDLKSATPEQLIKLRFTVRNRRKPVTP